MLHKMLLNSDRKSNDKFDRVRQFCQEVWTAGFTAHINVNLDAPTGLAWDGIHAKLGHAPGPVQHVCGGSTGKRKPISSGC